MEAPDPETSSVDALALKGIRLRALVVGFLLCLPVCYACSNANQSVIFSLLVPPISALLFCVVLNAPLRRFAPRLAFSQSDLIAIFAITSVAGVVAAEWVGIPHSTMYALPEYAKTNDTVKNYFLKGMPPSMVITDPLVTADIQGGGKGIGYATGRFLTDYLPKVLPWALMIGALTLAMQCLNSLMRGAWNERERLTFPLIQLPVAMSEGGGSGGMWRSRPMWIAFGVMFAIDMLNGLNYLYPNLPAIPVKTLLQVNTIFKEPPLNQMGDFRLSIYPFMAAIGLFMPSDMLLSFVVFFLMRKATHIALASQGIPQETFSGSGINPGPPYFDEQTWGAMLAMFLGAVWVSREYLKEVWRDIKTRAPSADGGIRHTYAFAGLVLTTALVAGFGVRYGDLSPGYATAYVVLFLILSTVITRIRAQVGPPTHEFAFLGVNSILGRFLGNRWLTDRQATWVTGGWIMMNRMYRNHPMPVQLEAMKMGQTERMRQRSVFFAIAAASVLGIFLCYYFNIVKAYRTGGYVWPEPVGFLDKILNDRHGPDIVGMGMTIFGFAVVLLLDIVRFRFPGFPLHPAGYVLSMNFGVDYYWFGLLLALLVKNFVQRYYGLTGYERLRQAALGILLAEYAAETIWMAMALITHQSTYTISFNDRSLLSQ